MNSKSTSSFGMPEHVRLKEELMQQLKILCEAINQLPTGDDFAIEDEFDLEAMELLANLAKEKAKGKSNKTKTDGSEDLECVGLSSTGEQSLLLRSLLLTLNQAEKLLRLQFDPVDMRVIRNPFRHNADEKPNDTYMTLDSDLSKKFNDNEIDEKTQKYKDVRVEKILKDLEDLMEGFTDPNTNKRKSLYKSLFCKFRKT